jgi:putative ABC transport system permease protein
VANGSQSELGGRSAAGLALCLPYPIEKPRFAAVAVLTLALGIGANTTIFSAINAVLLEPLPFRQPENVVSLWETESAPGSFPLTGPDYLEWRSQNKTFEDMSLYSWENRYNVSASDGADSALVVRTQANFFELLGIRCQLGRTFAKGEDQNGGSRVVVLSNGYWKKHFGGRHDALDKPLVLNSETYTVIGVLPSWYSLPGRSDLWIPLDMSAVGWASPSLSEG